MRGKKSFLFCINRFGRKVFLYNGCGELVQEGKCFIQALRYKNKMYTEGTPTDIGINDSGYYLLIGPPGLEIEKISDRGYITDSDKKYHIDRWEKIYLGEDVFYIWAVLKEHTTGCYPVYRHFR